MTAFGVIAPVRTTAENPAKAANDPCPPGWKVPSQYSWWDSSVGDGSNNVTMSSYTYANVPNNTWQWRDSSTNDGAIGGVLITNAAGERVFCPLPVIAIPLTVCCAALAAPSTIGVVE
ncbi:MAG: hypothetical protein LBT04_00935 [Prevotellaceae bacterium]|jgi:hypothetical protein|nr:hypothetical protein [Prevotellaceae bacterium]